LAPLVTAAGRIGLVAQEGITEATDRLGLLSGIVADLGSRNRAAVEALDVANRLLAEQFHGAVEVRSTYQAIVEQLDESDRRRLEEATRTRRNTSAVVRVVNSTEWICPVVGVTRFIDTWGEARSGNRTHEGVDIAAPSNTPVVAPVSGRVTYRWDSIGGRSFDLVADNGDYYFGTHLRRFGIEGRVAAGDNIGFVGSDGNADANILHLEYHPGGRGNPVNPYPLAYAHCDRSNG
jgi:murein DD-endopeptidase MepM/ murein hydrolase activator NlpD